MPIQIGVLKRSAPTMRVLRRPMVWLARCPTQSVRNLNGVVAQMIRETSIGEGKDRFDLGHMGVNDEQTVLRSNRSHT